MGTSISADRSRSDRDRDHRIVDEADAVTAYRAATTKDIWRLQEEVAKHEQVEMLAEHFFHGGMYVRKLLIPKGVVVVGKVHKREHFFIIARGDATVVYEGFRERITDPRVLVGFPGVKRAVYANEDTVCLNFHRSDLQSSHEVEAEQIEPDPTALIGSDGQILGRIGVDV